jgi:hypothetical protein
MPNTTSYIFLGGREVPLVLSIALDVSGVHLIHCLCQSHEGWAFPILQMTKRGEISRSSSWSYEKPSSGRPDSPKNTLSRRWKWTELKKMLTSALCFENWTKEEWQEGDKWQILGHVRIDRLCGSCHIGQTYPRSSGLCGGHLTLPTAPPTLWIQE